METVKLIWEEISKDKEGFPKRCKNEKEAYAFEKSVSRQEEYSSKNAGVTVKTVLEIRQEEWEETRHLVNGKPEYARKAIFDGYEYNIIRTWKRGKATRELICG